jgi:hypothetical protein
MKKNMKTTVMTMMVVGMTVSGAAGVFAGTNLQKITAYLNSGIGIKVNGQAFAPTDSNGNKLLPIFYHDTAYLPVKAIGSALQVPVTYDSKNGQILIGSEVASKTTVVDIAYSSAQIAEIQKAFSSFEGYESAYAPKLVLQGDTFLKAAPTDDGVNLLFSHMTVNVSPRDYSDGYDSKPVKLSNGAEAKWYKPGETDMLALKLEDRFVIISSPDNALTKAQLENVAIGVAKL